MKYQRATHAVLLPVLCATALAWTAPAAAQNKTFTCGRDFAQLGDSRTAVQMKCGRPAATGSICKQIEHPAPVTGNVTGQPTPELDANNRIVIRVPACENLEEWVYKPGVGQFVTTLRFREGELHEISYGPRM
ncbi:MAG: DUF2845 domain-containing protein [Burkholderiaceae bacterium]|nr:DUF2845 domain-containing protein [Burkholderiaceae bacterium]